ncbi:MAG: Zn-dependent hydrolase, partial [Actinomycetes bacterium]
MASASPIPHLRINGDRLIRRLMDLATISPIPGGGSSRLALTDDDAAGRDLVVGWMKELDLDVIIDVV